MQQRFDVVVVGGGAIGLATAYELAGRNVSVALVDRGPFGKEASWAGAGIISPAAEPALARNPLERLGALSYDKYAKFAADLLHTTGIDVGYRKTGGLILATDETARDEVDRLTAAWTSTGVCYERLDEHLRRELEPGLAAGSSGYWLPGVCQVRSPRLIEALIAACARRRVVLLPNRAVVDWQRAGVRITSVELADDDRLHASSFVLAAGAWSAELARGISLTVPVKPIRGQILALETRDRPVRHIVELGRCYLVPRDDDVLLVGSTEEDVGFEVAVTAAGIDGLRQFALGLFPALARAATLKTWAGLRPASLLGFPLVGRAPDLENLYLATGHFRQGLQLAPGTATVIADWILGSGQWSVRNPLTTDH